MPATGRPTTTCGEVFVDKPAERLYAAKAPVGMELASSRGSLPYFSQ